MQDSPMREFSAGIEILERDVCSRFLHESSVGCLGLSSAGAPELRTVNFAMDAGSLVFRTGDGPILEAGRRGLPASFQIFGIDGLEHTGWSVLVVGKLCQLESDQVQRELSLRCWASGLKDFFVGLSILELSGRRIPPGRGNR